MAKYRLKKDARKFFDVKLSKQIYSLESWQKHHGIPIELLDEVEFCYIVEGHKESDSLTSLANWSSLTETQGEANIKFTIKIDDISNEDYRRITENIHVTMDIIQKQLNKYFNQ